MGNYICSRFARVLGVLAAATLISAPSLVAQTGSVTGRVTDGQTGQSIAAAQVFIANLDIGVLSQQNGSYLLLNVPAGSHTLTVQRIGYREATQTVTVASGETVALDFQITEEALQLDEIIITGTPGGTQRRALGNTVATVDVGDITQDVAITNMQDLISGRTPGLQFTRLSGNVGTGSPMTIRGVGSFNFSRNQPLVYVDGVRVNNDSEAGPNLGGGDNVNVIDDFNPEDIESIEIIKGPAAASLYGTEASAGVIQIITKRGNEGAPEFNLSVRQGQNWMTDPAGRLGGMWTCPSDPGPGPTDCQNESDLVSYNMYDEANRYISDGYFPWPTERLYREGHTQSYNLDVRGGSQAVRYFLSGNYENEEGIIWYNHDETFRLRGNVGIVFNDNFSLDVSTGYVDGYTRFMGPTRSDGGVWQDLLWSNGHYLDRVNAFDGSGPGTSNVRLGGFQEHLPSDVGEVEATRDYSRFTGSATLNYTSGELDLAGIPTTITQRAVVGVDKAWDVDRQMFPLEDGQVPSNLTDYATSWAAVYSETVDGQMFYERPIQGNMSFDYAATIGMDVADAFSFNTAVGAQYYSDTSDYFANDGTGFASTLSTTINQLSQSTVSTDYSFVENKSLGFYIQEEIGYQDRLFLTGALRFDDNSTFGVDAPAQKYPKFSGTWVISEESFWNVGPVNSLRLRGAWGKAGRQPSATAGSNIYVAMTGPGGQAAVRPSSPGNPLIGPEVSTELEVGADIALFDDRISGEFTMYQRQDRDALLSIPLFDSFGFPGSVASNLGDIDNWGWEAQMSTRVWEGGGMALDLDVSADYTNNKIVDLGDYNTSDANIRIGWPYPNHTEGDIVTRAEFNHPDADQNNAFGVPIAGWCDAGLFQGPHGTYDLTTGQLDQTGLTQDQLEVNNRYGYLPGGPEVLCGTVPNRNIMHARAFFTNTFSIAPRLSLLDNQLQLFALAEGMHGKTHTENGMQWGHVYNNSKNSRLENDPIWTYSDKVNPGGSFTRTKTFFDASFWKLRELGMRYNIPSEWIAATGASRASLAVSARNLFTLWRAQEWVYGAHVSDPEYGRVAGGAGLEGGRSNYWETPPLASLNATLRVTF